MRATDDSYDGIAYEELPLEAVDWSERDEYIRRRSERKALPNEFDVEPEWATEAVMEPNRVVGPGRSRSGATIRVIGYSPGAGRLLTVLLLGKDEPVGGEWWGVDAWASSDRDMREYRERNSE
ncbi:MAG: hypothetical protein J2P45_26375 [Candidatus Dormibacteraeota bacterium]|nr:hypothetical protein [Candidatus Dormibacteraeota bacterium]